MRGPVFILLLLAITHFERSFGQVVANPVLYDTAGKLYTQNFDGLPAGGTYTLSGKGAFNLNAAPISGSNLGGWQVLMTSGSNANAAFVVGTGSSTGNGIYSFGTTGSTERALGSLAASSGIYAMGFILTNRTGNVLNSFTVSFTAEQWRKGGSTNKNTWSFRYKTGTITTIDQTDLTDDPNLNFSSVVNTSSATSLNGNLPENQQMVSYTVRGINWKAGEQLLLRWDDADETGSDDAVGIDNFNFSASLVSSLPSITNSVVTNVTANTAQASLTVNANYANTSVVFEYDSLNTFSAPFIIHPVPDTVFATAGNTVLSANITGLSSGITYYLHVKVHNVNGDVIGPLQSFTTIIDPPSITTLAVSGVTTNTAVIGGNVTAAGGAAVTEKGVVWSTSVNPTIANNKSSAGAGVGNFVQTIIGLPQATTVYVRTYAINAGGISYGDTIRFTTQTIIASLGATSAARTNAVSVTFNLKTAQTISAPMPTNFSLLTNGIDGASITSITGTTNSFTITVSTGTGDGTIGLALVNDLGIFPSINNKPFTATGFYTIDKSAPVINLISIPDRSIKIGDTIPVLIFVKPDADNYKMVTAKIDGFALTGFTKKNDSVYTSYFVVTAGGVDVAASDNIPVSISLRDSSGNTNALYQESIIQSSDPIDANKPFINAVLLPPDKIYKLGDTLDITTRFNENIFVAKNTGTPSLSLTIGTKTRPASYILGSNTNSLLFRYIVQVGDVDTNGIKLSSTLTLNNSEIKDMAGNAASLSLTNIASTKNIIIDGTVASVTNVIIPANGLYTTGDTLDFAINFTEKVFVNIQPDTPVLKLTIGTISRNMNYISGSGSSSLLFRYIIQKGDPVKNALSLGASIVLANSTIINLSGNQSLLTLKNVPSLSNIKIDVIIPPTGDTISPIINSVNIPDRSMKIGDTIPVIISVKPDADNYKIVTAKIDGFTLAGFTKKNDSLYTSYFIVTPGGVDVVASDNISVSISLRDSTGNTNALYQEPIIQSSDPIDANKPFINAVLLPPDKIYKVGDTLDITTRFSENIFVTKNSGAPSLSLTIGTKTRSASYVLGSNTNSLLFRYLVQAGDVDTDGIKLSSSLALNNSEIKDMAGNAASLSLGNIASTKNIVIDGTVASVTNVVIPANGLYTTGDTLDFTINFTEKVFVNIQPDTPVLKLTIGTISRNVNYISGSGSSSLLFRYIIQKDDPVKNTISLGTSIFLANSTIINLSGNPSLLTLKNIPSLSNIKIDVVIPVIIDTVPPIINSVNIPDRSMKIGDTIPVMISVKPDADNYKIVTGKIDGFTLSGFTKKNDSTYNCYFIIVAGGNDVAASANIPVSLSLRDSAGNTNVLYQQPIIQSSDLIDANKPFIGSVIIPVDRIYKLGDTLDLIIKFNEPIFVTTTLGTPSLSLTIGSKTRTALYISGSNTNSLLFRYIVQAGDLDTNGIQLPSVVTLNSSEIKDMAGNIASLGLNNIPSTKNIWIDGTVASVVSVVVPANGSYTTGDSLDLIVRFTEKVFVTINADTPVVKLTIGNIAHNMNYINGSGSSDLRFRYIVQKGDLDKNGITIGSSIVTNSVITNLTGNDASLSLKNVPALSGIKIDAVAPLFFIGGTQNISVCENAEMISASNTASITDDETGELVTWKIISDTKHGSLSMQNTSAISNGKTITPGNIYYKVFKNYNGIDSFVIQVSDGINISQKTIVINIQPAIKNNLIDALPVACINSTTKITGTPVTGGDGNYQYIWETTTGSDSSVFTRSNGSNGLQDHTTAQLTASTWLRRRIISGTCADTSTPIKINVLKNGLWSGSINNDWHNGNNWCGASVPNNTTDVYVYANALYDPVITDTARCNHLIIADNVHLLVTGILQVSGNINSAKDLINAQKGTVVFTGTTPQIIPGSSFAGQVIKDLIINNHSGVTLNDQLAISGSLLLNNGSFTTNDNLSLRSTAVIAPSAAGTSIIGKVAVEHFIKGGKRAFRLVGHPFADAIGLQMIKDSLDITGENGFLNGFTTTLTNQPSAFRHDPLMGNDSTGIDAGWIAFTHTNGIAENAWKRYNGTRLFVRGRPGQGLDGTPAGNGKNGTYLPQPVTIKLTGNVNTGDQEVMLSKDVYAGYNVMANPYVSNIDLSRITKGKDIGSSYWLWNPLQGKQGGYTSFLFRSKNILPPFGAFIAKSNGNNSNKILFTENCKSTNAYSDSITPINLDDIFYVELRLETDSIFWDRIVLLEMDSAKTGFDKNDAEKFWNSDVNFYSISREQKKLSIDARPVNNETIIPLGLQVNEQGVFKIRVERASLPFSNTLMLHDRYYHKWMPLEKDSSYSFFMVPDTINMGNDRFEIASQEKIIDTVVQETIVTKVNPVPAKSQVIVQYKSPEKGNTSIRLLSLSGNPLKTIQLGIQKEGQAVIAVGDLLSGVYLLELRCGNLVSTQKIIKD